MSLKKMAVPATSETSGQASTKCYRNITYVTLSQIYSSFMKFPFILEFYWTFEKWTVWSVLLEVYDPYLSSDTNNGV